MTLRRCQSCRAQGRSHQIKAVCNQKGCSITASDPSTTAAGYLDGRLDRPVCNRPHGSRGCPGGAAGQVRLSRSGTIIGASTRAIRGRKKNRTDGTARRLSNFSASRSALSL